MSNYSSSNFVGDIQKEKAITAFKAKNEGLTLLIKSMVPDMANTLYSKDIIDQDTFDAAMLETQTKKYRTVALLTAVQDVIAAKPQMFKEFVIVLENKPTLRSLASELVQKYLQGMPLHTTGQPSRTPEQSSTVQHNITSGASGPIQTFREDQQIIHREEIAGPPVGDTRPENRVQTDQDDKDGESNGHTTQTSTDGWNSFFRNPVSWYRGGVAIRMVIESYDARDRGTYRPVYLNLKGNTVKMTHEPHQQHADSYYPMRGLKHGVCLIINNTIFEKEDERIGTEVDEYNLKETFLYLGYQVEVRRNCSKQQMENILWNIDRFLAENARNVDNDSFVCCILSHGNENSIVASDSQVIPNAIKMLECKAGESITLKFKPKLFFIQACRGGSELTVTTDARRQAGKKGDTFIHCATSVGDAAYLNTHYGSWYITELTKHLCQYATSRTLNQIQKNVNRVVSEQYTKTDHENHMLPTTEQPGIACATMKGSVHFFDESPNAPELSQQ